MLIMRLSKHCYMYVIRVTSLWVPSKGQKGYKQQNYIAICECDEYICLLTATLAFKKNKSLFVCLLTFYCRTDLSPPTYYRGSKEQETAGCTDLHTRIFQKGL